MNIGRSDRISADKAMVDINTDTVLVANDLTTTGLETLGSKVCLEHFEELLDHTRLAQTPSEECDGDGIWIQARQPQAEGCAYAEAEKLLQNEHLEQNQRIYPFATCIALSLLGVTFIKKWAE